MTYPVALHDRPVLACWEETEIEPTPRQSCAQLRLELGDSAAARVGTG